MEPWGILYCLRLQILAPQTARKEFEATSSSFLAEGCTWGGYIDFREFRNTNQRTSGEAAAYASNERQRNPYMVVVFISGGPKIDLKTL